MPHNDRIGGIMLVVLALLATPAIAPAQEVLEDVILITRDKEVVAFSSVGNKWVLIALRAQERVLESRTASRVALVVTNQRALGFSSITNQWSETNIDVGEQILEVEAKGFVASVDTNFRALGFGGRQGTWKEYRYRFR